MTRHRSRKKREKEKEMILNQYFKLPFYLPFSHPKSRIRSIFGFVQRDDREHFCKSATPSFTSTVKKYFPNDFKDFLIFISISYHSVASFLPPITPPRRLEHHLSLEIRNQNHQYEKPQKRWESSQLEALHYDLGAESSKKIIINFHFSNSSSMHTHIEREHEILIRDLTCNLPLVSRIRPNHQPENIQRTASRGIEVKAFKLLMFFAFSYWIASKCWMLTNWTWQFGFHVKIFTIFSYVPHGRALSLSHFR